MAGCKASLEASRLGARVLLLEEHPQVGIPSHCSGVVSLNGLSLIDVEAHPNFSQRLVRGARLHPPTGPPLVIRREKPVALILNRMRFDQYLAKNAVAEGVELRTRSKVSKFVRLDDGNAKIVQEDGREIVCKAVVCAAGAGCRLPEQVGLETPDWSHILPGLQYELVDSEPQDDLVELFFGSDRAPEFFAWSIPTGDRSQRVGLASRKGNVKILLDKLVKENWPTSTVEATKSGPVLASGPIRQCWSPNFLVAGDAAGQVKQTTGGGIVIGGYCGRLAGRAAAKFVGNTDNGIDFLREYDLEWRKIFGAELSRMGLARRIFASLSDDTLTRLFRMIESHLDEIEKTADMDFQAEIISRFLRKKELVSILPRLAVDSIRAIFT